MDSWYTYDLNNSFIPYNVVFPLKKISFEGLNCYIPNQPNQFLNFQFKNYMNFPDDIGIEKHNVYLRN